MTDKGAILDETQGQALLRLQGVSQLRQVLLAPAPLEDKLRSVTEAIVRLFDADFCRIWLIRPGDRCEQDCMHAEVREGPHVCKMIRDDKGSWSQVESYVQQHSEATFTHGLCPDCVKKYFA